MKFSKFIIKFKTRNDIIVQSCYIKISLKQFEIDNFNVNNISKKKRRYFVKTKLTNIMNIGYIERYG